jgi:hypothetical protein
MGIPPVFGLRVVVVLAPPLRQRLKLSDEQKKQLDGLQKETEGKIEAALQAEQQKTLKEARARFVNAWGGGAPPPPAKPAKPDKADKGAKPAKPDKPPAPVGGPPNLGASVFRSYRYAADYPGLAGKDLKPGKTIEEMQAAADKK